MGAGRDGPSLPREWRLDLPRWAAHPTSPSGGERGCGCRARRASVATRMATSSAPLGRSPNLSLGRGEGLWEQVETGHRRHANGDTMCRAGLPTQPLARERRGAVGVGRDGPSSPCEGRHERTLGRPPNLAPRALSAGPRRQGDPRATVHRSTCNLQPATSQPATCNPHPVTCNLQPETCNPYLQPRTQLPLTESRSVA